jgi:hypothetical protein
VDEYIVALKKELDMYAQTKYVKTSVFDELVLGGEHQASCQPSRSWTYWISARHDSPQAKSISLK